LKNDRHCHYNSDSSRRIAGCEEVSDQEEVNGFQSQEDRRVASDHRRDGQRAIKELEEKKVSSLLAIKKYLAVNYKINPTKLAPFIRKFLKTTAPSPTVPWFRRSEEGASSRRFGNDKTLRK